MSSKDILANDLRAAGAPSDMVIRAMGGYYSDYDSPLATPCIQLVQDARAAGLHGVANAAMDGKYDATEEESEAFAKRAETDPELGPIVKALGLGPRRK